jgi:hypothetical protein
MKRYRYPTSALRGDYIRAGIGVLVTGGMLIGASAVPVMFVLIGAIFLLFLGFGLQTWSRHMSMFEIMPDGLMVYGLRRKKLAWSDLQGARLRFFTTKKDRDAGWMELTILSESGKTRIDSNIEGFKEILSAVAKQTESRGLPLDENSVENLRSLGIETKSPGLPDAAKKWDKSRPWDDEL